MSADPSVPVAVPAPGSVDPVDVFELGAEHEQVVFCNDPATGLRAIVAIHSTALGPALGGTRFYPYASTPTRCRRPESLAGHVLQGGAGRPRPRRRQGRDHRRPGDGQDRGAAARLRPLRPVARTAATSPPATSAPSPPDMDVVARECRFVTGRPSPTGARATRRCSRRTACSRACAPAPRPSGARRASPAAGSASPASARSVTIWSSTWSRTARRVVVTDVNPAAVDAWCGEYGATAVADADALVRAEIDVYAPCAMGGALTDDVVDVLTAKIVCGAANNQLAHPGIEKALADRGILYAPDYCVNSGGLIQVADELEGFSFDRAQQRAAQIYDTTRRSSSSPRPSRPRRPRPPTGSPSAGCATSAACAACGCPGADRAARVGPPGRSSAARAK